MIPVTWYAWMGKDSKLQLCQHMNRPVRGAYARDGQGPQESRGTVSLGDVRWPGVFRIVPSATPRVFRIPALQPQGTKFFKGLCKLSCPIG